MKYMASCPWRYSVSLASQSGKTIAPEPQISRTSLIMFKSQPEARVKTFRMQYMLALCTPQKLFEAAATIFFLSRGTGVRQGSPESQYRRTCTAVAFKHSAMSLFPRLISETIDEGAQTVSHAHNLSVVSKRHVQGETRDMLPSLIDQWYRLHFRWAFVDKNNRHTATIESATIVDI